MKIFSEFPGDQYICPICKCDTKDKKCILIPVPETEDNNFIEAVPIHVECLQLDWRKNKNG